MLLNQKFVTIGQFDLRLNHLLIIGILVLSFSTSFLLRTQAAEFGFELNEFDPFFNFRATEYIVENGIDEYFEWNDDLSWYPIGRDVSSTSQVILHITGAILYWIFGGSTELYDFTILLPVVFGSLNCNSPLCFGESNWWYSSRIVLCITIFNFLASVNS